MSDDTSSDEQEEQPTETTEAAEDQPEPAESSASEEDERPEIEDDERADLDLSGVDLDEVDDEGEEGEDGTGTETNDDSSDEQAETSPSPAQTAGGDLEATWGDMYVDILATVLVSIIDEHGDGSREMDAEDIEALANQPPIALNEQADRLFEEMGGTKDLPPGQALVIGSATVAGSVLVRETNVAEDIAGEIADKAGGKA
jgi:hypothetical protein